MAIIIEVKVIPGSGKSVWQLDGAGKLKCYLKSAPEKGMANRELIKTLTKALGISQQDAEIMSGLTSRNKKIKIHTAHTFNQILDALGIDQQRGLFDE